MRVDVRRPEGLCSQSCKLLTVLHHCSAVCYRKLHVLKCQVGVISSMNLNNSKLSPASAAWHRRGKSKYRSRSSQPRMLALDILQNTGRSRHHQCLR